MPEAGSRGPSFSLTQPTLTQWLSKCGPKESINSVNFQVSGRPIASETVGKATILDFHQPLGNFPGGKVGVTARKCGSGSTMGSRTRRAGAKGTGHCTPARHPLPFLTAVHKQEVVSFGN